MIHLVLFMILFFFVLHKKKYKEAINHLPAIYYFSFFNLLYMYIGAKEKEVWNYGHYFINSFLTDILFIFFIYPSMVYLYLHGLPEKNKLFYMGKWVIFSSVTESIYHLLGGIRYYHHWNIFWSLFFYIIMYPMIYLHMKKPFLTIVISLFVTFFLLYLFKYNIYKK